MKRIATILLAAVITLTANSQTLNVISGGVTTQYTAAQAGEMTYSDSGATLTISGKAYSTNDITKIYTDESTVGTNAVDIAYNGSSASVTISGDCAQYITATVSGAHVSIVQADPSEEITYTLSGTSTDGEFYMEGTYKASLLLNGVTLTNPSGAAINIQDGKRIEVKMAEGTTNTLTDCSSGSQKACLVIKGHGEFKGQGTLNIYANTNHGIKTGEYMSVKNCTINVLSSVGDGFHVNEYFLMESGTVKLSGLGDDGIKVELDGTTSTGETTDHEDEDSGNIYLEGGTLTAEITGTASKGINADGDIKISDGTYTITTSGNGTYDSDDADTKGSAGLKCDGNLTISGGTIKCTSTGSGGKGINVDGTITISGGTITASASGKEYTYSSYSTAPKGIKCDGAMKISGGIITASSSHHEGIETKSTLDITGGYVGSTASDDAINAASHLTISGGYVMAISTGNDGIDSNGNMYIKGGTVYASCSGSPEVALDANTEGGYTLYVQGGTLIAIGGLENGASCSQTCYQASSWNKSTWYAINNGSETFAFKTPSSGGSGMVVSAASTPTLTSGVSVSGGSEYFSMINVGGSVSGGSSVSLSSYSGGNGGMPGEQGGSTPGGNGGGPGGNSGGGPGGH